MQRQPEGPNARPHSMRRSSVLVAWQIWMASSFAVAASAFAYLHVPTPYFSRKRSGHVDCARRFNPDPERAPRSWDTSRSDLPAMAPPTLEHCRRLVSPAPLAAETNPDPACVQAFSALSCAFPLKRVQPSASPCASNHQAPCAIAYSLLANAHSQPRIEQAALAARGQAE